MTNEAREAITYLRSIAEEWNEDGLDMSATYMSETADTLESGLRRCRAETLREAADLIETEYYRALDAAEWMRCMADKAEQEET